MKKVSVACLLPKRALMRSAGSLALAMTLVLAACGGGDASKSAKSSEPVGKKQARDVTGAAVDPTLAASQGSWGAVHDWPLIPIHAVLLPDGRVLSYGSRPDGSTSGYFSVDVWDNAGLPSGGHSTVSNGTGADPFCGSQLLLPPAGMADAPSVFIAGGDAFNGTSNTLVGIRRTTVFNAGSNSMASGADMAYRRWYASSITLVTGETYIQGGYGGSDRPEVRQLDGTFRHLSTADTRFLQWTYPRNYVVPDGRVFGYDYEGRMYFVETADTGRVDARAILPLQYFGSGTSAMFRPGRILQVGGNTNASAVIDVTTGATVFQPTQSTSTVRKLATATLLADGQVLITGGSPVWNELPGVNRAAEIWNPVTGQWTLGAEGARPRLYHSTALLLPDASVWVGGGGGPAPSEADPAGERNTEIYFPPYLFAADGSRAARPVIVSAPQSLEIGKTFALDVNRAGTSRVTLVKTGSVTHGWNFDQRFLDLTFTRTATPEGERLAVNAPSRPGEATPGYYMVFVFDSAGVPSQAQTVRIGIAGATDTGKAPVLTPPGNRRSDVGAAVSLQLSATDPNQDALVYSAAGLPPGLSLDATTGRITGSPSRAGSYDLVVSVSDGTYTSGASLVWTVNSPVALAITSEPKPGASLVGVSALFNAAAEGSNVQYQWNFGDGSPDSAWSSDAFISKVYDNPGSYVVTLRVRDSSGAVLSRSFLQTAYRGTASSKPGISGSMAIEAPASDRPRLWVVNQDNDSITGIDTATHTVLAEVPVGAGPRSIAVAPSGMLWVTDRFDGTISIVNPNTQTRVRTISLPRGSQPYGIAMSPTAPMAFVVLEGTGEVLRFDSSTYTLTGRMAVGPNARHVSVDGFGRTAYVTRYITPPLPGESTAAVSVPPDRGGEVLEFDPTTLTVTRTIFLAHSNKADAENQGSGIPNYLGPVSISPDGTQAYVPSKQDNILRGTLRNRAALNFQNTVRAISSRIVLQGEWTGSEDLVRRIDHDNASLASAIAFDGRGVLMFVALETSREVAVLDAYSGAQIMRFDVGRAPQGLTLSPDGYTLYVNNFMDRTVSAHDLKPLLTAGLASVPTLTTVPTVSTERLNATVLRGKQLFYDARDARLARDGYMSCATCHTDGGHDGRVWDMTQMGEGLRNTISLRGRGGMKGRLHWTGNFDEVQDFEGQIRVLAGGTGLLTDEQFTAGTRSQPLGERKAGLSADLDALSAYVASLTTTPPSPLRQANGSLTGSAAAGKAVFAAQCASCHGGPDFSSRADFVLHDVGTANAASGGRLGQALNGLDAPSLRDTWATAPYLHNGSAATVEAAIQAHARLSLTPTELGLVADYTRQIGGEDEAAPASEANLVVRALATLMDAVGALFEVRVNNEVVGTGQLDSTRWVDLFFNVATLVKDAIVEVIFKNDASSATADRNLAVQSITVNGQSRIDASTADAVIDRGAGQRAFDQEDTRPAASTGGWLPWDAALRFKLPALGGGDTVTVRARATLAGGVGALMELRVNGVLMGSRLISATTVEDQVFVTPPIQTGDRIDVVFTNDEEIAGEDRNLFVESVTARGFVLPATTRGFTLDQGSGASAFDGVGVVPANATGGWVPWNGALRMVAQ